MCVICVCMYIFVIYIYGFIYNVTSMCICLYCWSDLRICCRKNVHIQYHSRTRCSRNVHAALTQKCTAIQTYMIAMIPELLRRLTSAMTCESYQTHQAVSVQAVECSF